MQFINTKEVLLWLINNSYAFTFFIIPFFFRSMSLQVSANDCIINNSLRNSTFLVKIYLPISVSSIYQAPCC